MRKIIMLAIIAPAAALVGCASRPDSSAQAPKVYLDSPSTALVFDPPVIAGERPVDLYRDARLPSAFVGYEELTAQYFSTRVQDRQADDGSQRYIRESNIQRVGVSYR